MRIESVVNTQGRLAQESTVTGFSAASNAVASTAKGSLDIPASTPSLPGANAKVDELNTIMASLLSRMGSIQFSPAALSTGMVLDIRA
jgi:hypothetical protein